MKRFISILLLVLIVLTCPVVASALINSNVPTPTPGITDSPTYKRGAFEFAELFAYRFGMLNQKLGDKFDMSFITIPFVQDYGETYSVPCSGAYLTISKEDFSVESAVFILYKLNADDDENDELYYQAAVAISALEHNGSDDSLLDIMYRAGISESKNATEEGIRILNSEIYPIVTKNYYSIISSKDELEVYSGNYRYLVSYLSYENDGRKLAYIHLTARAK